MKILGLDVGEKRIGVAKVDSNTRIAVPVGYILNDASLWQEIGRLARLNNTSLFVLGLPRSNEGNETKQTLYVRQFARTLTEKIPEAKVRFQDESLTSVEAEERLKKRKKKYEKGDIDAEAAAIILQDFVENFRESDRGATPENAASVSREKSREDASQHLTKVAVNTKKVSDKVKKWTIFGVPVVLLLILGGITAGLKYRDHVIAQREAYFKELEDAMEPEVFTFTILPGETVRDVRKKLIEVGYESTEVDVALSADYDFDFLKDRPTGASLEGYLYGETYEFYQTATAKEVVSKFLEGMGAVIAENRLSEKYAERGLTLFQGVTLASIVQKEAPGPEMATVAQVFLSRLNYGWKLGSDVTVTYALDLIDPERTTYTDHAAALEVDSCYNTRKNVGLPCGPIANPGLTALLAVAEPTDTSYLYFLTGDDGMMYYSYTEAEHNRNAAEHCKELCAVAL